VKKLFEPFVRLFCETEKDRGKRGWVRSAHLDRKFSSEILIMQCAVRVIPAAVVLQAVWGSFDFVRLAPHFAQEDRDGIR
jgi:hypothetical protein